MSPKCPTIDRARTKGAAAAACGRVALVRSAYSNAQHNTNVHMGITPCNYADEYCLARVHLAAHPALIEAARLYDTQEPVITIPAAPCLVSRHQGPLRLKTLQMHFLILLQHN